MENKEKEQDQRWDELSEESQQKVRKLYLENLEESHKPDNSDEMVNVLLGKNEMLIDLFGYSNVSPPLLPKTWEDIEASEEDINIPKDLSDKLIIKNTAAMKIAYLIENFYGGMIRDNEWMNCDEENPIYVIRGVSRKKGNMEIKPDISFGSRYFIAFHTQEQRNKFISRESNKRLIQNYYMVE